MKYYTTSKLSENMHTTPEGYLLCVGVPIARTGEMVYGEGETPLATDDDGKILIDREEKEVFRPETMASFEGKPVTIAHPTDQVTPESWARLAKGILQNVRRGTGDLKDSLIADVLITDSVAIGLVKSGLREVSCGYDARYLQQGEGRGIQTHIIGNHLALVEQGRAGSSYAIHDHKGKGDKKMSLKDKIGSIFAKAQDEAMKAAKDAEAEVEKKKDDAPAKAKDEEGSGMDAIVKMVKDLGEKIDKLSGAKDGKEDLDSKKVAPKAESKDDEGDVPPETPATEGEAEEPAVEDRLKALEASVAKILEMLTDEDSGEEEQGEESDTDDAEGMPKSTLTGDTASRAEILAPGIKVTKDVKVQALKTAYGTKEGKKLIESLNGGRAPAYDSAEKVNHLFIATSELLKASRMNEFVGTKKTTYDHNAFADDSSAMTAEKMNEINAKHFGKK